MEATYERGNVTVIALILLVVLTLIGISANLTSTLDMQIARNEIPFKQEFYIAEGAVNIEANYIGKGYYPVTDLDTPEILHPDDAHINSPDKHKVHSSGDYDYTVTYKGPFAPPAGYSILDFSRYDYEIETRGHIKPGTEGVRVFSRFYKIGPKAR